MSQALLLDQLSEKYVQKKCHSMASIIKGETIDGSSADQFTKELFESKFFAAVKRHSKSQDTTAELVDLANIIIEAPAEEGIGEELVHRVDFNTPGSRKIRIREPAVTSDTARGKSSRGRGTRNSYISLDPNEEIEAHETWDENFIEDADWNVAQDETEGLSTALKLATSQKIIDAFLAIPVAQTNSEALHGVATPGTLSFDDLVDMRQKMKNLKVNPDTLVLNSLQMGDLLKEEVFQNSLRYGDFTNKGEGYIGSFYGMNIYETSQLPSGNVLMFQKRYTMLFAVRRYAMMKSFQDFAEKKSKILHGLQLSTRYELKTGDASYLLKSDNA